MVKSTRGEWWAKALAASIAAVLAACAGRPAAVEYDTESLYVTTPDGLQRVKHWNFNDAFVKPGADLAHYDRVVIEDVTIAYKRPKHSVHMTDEGIESGTYKLSEAATGTIKDTFRRAFVQEFGKSEVFTVTESPAPSAIRVSGHIVNLVVYVAPFSTQTNASTVFVSNRSEMTLVVNVRDSETGAPLVRIGERSGSLFDGANAALAVNPVTTNVGSWSVFQRVAMRFRQHLDEIHALPKIPLLPGSSSGNTQEQAP